MKIVVMAICASLILISLMAGLVRVFNGPDDANRSVGSDLLFFSIVALLAISGGLYASPHAFDLVLIGSTVGFLASLAMGRAILRGRR